MEEEVAWLFSGGDNCAWSALGDVKTVLLRKGTGNISRQETLQRYTVRRNKVQNEPNIKSADKSLKFRRDARFGILIKKIFGPM